MWPPHNVLWRVAIFKVLLWQHDILLSEGLG